MMLIAVVSLLVSSFAALLWGVSKTFKAIAAIASPNSGADPVPYYLIHSVDAFLIAIILFMFAASIYELFIGKLDMPHWIAAHDFYELKNKLGGMVILVMAVEFVGRLFKGQDPLELVYTAIAVALISGVLIGFGLVTGKTGAAAKQLPQQTSGPDFADLTKD